MVHEHDEIEVNAFWSYTSQCSGVVYRSHNPSDNVRRFLNLVKMHSSLAPHLHQECLNIIQKLNACHEEHTVGKYFGACNKIKIELKECLKKERENKRKVNAEKAIRAKELWDKKHKEYTE